MNLKKFFSNPKSLVIVLFGAIALALFANFIFKTPQVAIRGAPGVPILSFAIEPNAVAPDTLFDLVLKVNPNGATFNAFELYSYYDPTKVEFQDPTNLSQNISSSYILIKSEVDPTSSLITIIGVRVGSPFSGTVDQEIARVNLKVNAQAAGDMIFTWDNNTKLGSKIARDTVDGVFPIGLVDLTPTPTPLEQPTDTPILFPTDTPIPLPTDTPPVSSQAGLSFKLALPDVVAPIISASDVEIELRDGSSTVEIANMNFVQEGSYYKTGSPVFFNISENKSYDVFIKARISIGRLFYNVNLTQGQTLDCIYSADASCGDLAIETGNRPLLSGDSDGFNTASGSYNQIDSADLQAVGANYNQPAIGGADVADYNLDGQINIGDLEIIGKNYSQVGD